MLNKVVQLLTGKNLVIFNSHRNSNPLLEDENRKKYIFINPFLLIKFSALFGRNSRIRYRIFAGLLTIINPAFILDINWIDKHQRVYYTWCKKNGKKFVVVQHGAYTAGIQRDIGEKYIGCQLFLVWGEHYKRQIEQANPGKEFECVVFGNPVYNAMDRTRLEYQEGPCQKILVAISVIHGERLKSLIEFLKKLEGIGCEITVKEHSLQSKLSKPINGFTKTQNNLYGMLEKGQYDLVIADISSTMLDVIFFKNRVFYYSPPGDDMTYTNNVYSRFLKNMYEHADRIQSLQDLDSFIDIKAQEELLKTLVETEGVSNCLSGLPLVES